MFATGPCDVHLETRNSTDLMYGMYQLGLRAGNIKTTPPYPEWVDVTGDEGVERLEILAKQTKRGHECKQGLNTQWCWTPISPLLERTVRFYCTYGTK